MGFLGFLSNIGYNSRHFQSNDLTLARRWGVFSYNLIMITNCRDFFAKEKVDPEARIQGNLVRGLDFENST